LHPLLDRTLQSRQQLVSDIDIRILATQSAINDPDAFAVGDRAKLLARRLLDATTYHDCGHATRFQLPDRLIVARGTRSIDAAPPEEWQDAIQSGLFSCND